MTNGAEKRVVLAKPGFLRRNFHYAVADCQRHDAGAAALLSGDSGEPPR